MARRTRAAAGAAPCAASSRDALLRLPLRKGCKGWGTRYCTPCPMRRCVSQDSIADATGERNAAGTVNAPPAPRFLQCNWSARSFALFFRAGTGHFALVCVATVLVDWVWVRRGPLQGDERAGRQQTSMPRLAGLRGGMHACKREAESLAGPGVVPVWGPATAKTAR